MIGTPRLRLEIIVNVTGIGIGIKVNVTGIRIGIRIIEFPKHWNRNQMTLESELESESWILENPGMPAARLLCFTLSSMLLAHRKLLSHTNSWLRCLVRHTI